MAHYERRIWPSADPLSGRSRRNRRGGSYDAFVPDELVGRSFLLRGDDVADAADAERAIAKLNETKAALANTEALARVLLRAESVASSRMEGLIVGARRLLAPFGACELRSAVSFADLLLGEVGQQHTGRALAIAKRFWPRPVVRHLPALGLLLLIEAKK